MIRINVRFFLVCICIAYADSVRYASSSLSPGNKPVSSSLPSVASVSSQSLFASTRRRMITDDTVMGTPALPHPAGPPTISWFAAGNLPDPCWYDNTTDTYNTSAFVPLTNTSSVRDVPFAESSSLSSSSPVLSIPIHPLYLLSYSKRIVIPNDTNTDKINNTLFILGGYKGCKGATSTVYPLLYDPCELGEVTSTMERSTDYGKSWTTCTKEIIPHDLIKFGQSTLVFQHPRTLNVKNSSHAAAVPLVFDTVDEGYRSCHLMCLFGGMLRYTKGKNSTKFTPSTVTFPNITAADDTYILTSTTPTNTSVMNWYNVDTVHCCRLPECNVWIPQSSLPWGVSYGTAIQFGDDIYIVGGDQDNGKSSLFQTTVNFTTCSLGSWTVPIDEVPVAPRRIGIMATEMMSTKTLLVGGGTTISSTGEPLYPNPDLWATETPAILSSWRMLTPSLPLGDVSNSPTDDLTGIFDFTSIVTDQITGTPLPLTWVYAARKAYALVMDSTPPRVTLFNNLWYPNPSRTEIPSQVPQIRQPVIMYDPTISSTGHPSIFALPIVSNNKYYNKLIRIDIVRCYDMCFNDTFTNGCTAYPRDALCYPCKQCASDGVARITSKCQSQYLNYGDTECEDCATCAIGYDRIQFCNDTHDTLCAPRSPNFSVLPYPNLNVDADVNPIYLRMVFILAGSCGGFLILLSVIFASFIRMPPNAHNTDRLVEVTRYIRSLWPFAFSIASVVIHISLAVGLISISNTVFFKPAVIILFIVITNVVINAFVSVIVYRSVALYSASSPSFTIDSLWSLNSKQTAFFPTLTSATTTALNNNASTVSTTTTTVTSPLPIAATAFRSIVKTNKMTSTIGFTSNTDNAILGIGTNGPTPSNTIPSPTGSSSIPDFPFSSSSSSSLTASFENYGYRTNNHNTNNSNNRNTSSSHLFSSPSMNIFNLTLALTMFHPRCLLHVYPNHVHGPSLLPSVRYIHSFAIRWITVSTFTYDAPLLLLCLIMLGNVYVVRTSSAFILCALLGFVNIVSTLSWSAAISAKIKASTVLSGGLGRSNSNSTLPTVINSPPNSNLVVNDVRRFTHSSSSEHLDAELVDLNMNNATNNGTGNVGIDTHGHNNLNDSVLGEIIAPPSVVRSTVINPSNASGMNDIGSSNRQVAVARALGVLLPHSSPPNERVKATEGPNETEIDSVNNDDSNHSSNNHYSAHQRPIDMQSMRLSIVSSPALSTTSDIPRAIANMRRQMELYPHDDSVLTGTNISLKDDVSESARTYLSSQVV